jgi:hypothetical protein
MLLFAVLLIGCGGTTYEVNGMLNTGPEGITDHEYAYFLEVIEETHEPFGIRQALPEGTVAYLNETPFEFEWFQSGLTTMPVPLDSPFVVTIDIPAWGDLRNEAYFEIPRIEGLEHTDVYVGDSLRFIMHDSEHYRWTGTEDFRFITLYPQMDWYDEEVLYAVRGEARWESVVAIPARWAGEKVNYRVHAKVNTGCTDQNDMDATFTIRYEDTGALAEVRGE